MSMTKKNLMMDHLKRMVACAAAFCLAAGAGVAHAELKPEKLYQRALPSVMTLEVENAAGHHFVGSAVLALGDDTALTAWHLVCDARVVWATFADGQRVRSAGCIDRSSQHDLALIKLDKPMPHRRAVLSRQLQPVAARAYVIGAPKGFRFSISDGLISQMRLVDGFPQYQLSCPISPGNSGGPVLNDRGEVTAIISWMKADAPNVSFAVPVGEATLLNASAAPTPWARVAAASLETPAKSQKSEASQNAGVRRLAPDSVNSSHPVSRAPDPESAGGDFESFKKRLEKAAGRPVTVLLQEEGQKTRFDFTVPREGLK
jgi:S1-C subfamily serine protease